MIGFMAGHLRAHGNVAPKIFKRYRAAGEADAGKRVMETREDPARLHRRQFTKQSHLARASAAGIPRKLRTLFAATRLPEGFLDRGV